MEFINPNWHVAVVHFPIALLAVGTVLELATLIWSREGLRTTGRWMLLLGTLLAIPTVTTGIYAFRDVVAPQAAQVKLLPWQEVVRENHWPAEAWESMDSHIWWTVSGVVCFAVVVATWLIASPEWRRRLYWPLVLFMLAGLGLLSGGAWFSGEAVYRHGVGVGVAAGPLKAPPEVTYFLPPLQLHLLLAGFTVALALLSLALLARQRTSHPSAETADDQCRAARCTQRRFWWSVALLAILTALAGDWATWSALGDKPLRKNWELLTDATYVRLIAHLLVGAGIVLTPLIWAIALYWPPRRRRWAVLGAILILVAVPLQIWLGITMLYDGRAGPLWHFNPPPAAAPR